MSDKEVKDFEAKLAAGFAAARYKLLREKALHDYVVVEGTPDGGVRKVPARKLLRELYGEEVVAIAPATKE